MLMSKMLFKIKNICLFKIEGQSKEDVSEKFNLDFSLINPSYSDLLEQIPSNILDKSSEI